MFELTYLWAAVIALGVVVYVILDGFDLGIGIIFFFQPRIRHRDVMMSSIAPMWDGNETWMILGGAGLLAAFPKAYALLLSTLYIPILLMLLALVFRGVAFEFRFKTNRHRLAWGVAFSVGSTIAAFCQGAILGTVVHGIPVVDGEYVGGSFGWLTPFSVFTGLAVMTGYVMLGATWLIMKTVGDLQAWSYRVAKRVLPLWLLMIAGVSVWTALSAEPIAERWFSLPNFYFLSQVPMITTAIAGFTWWNLYHSNQRAPFYLTIGLFVLSFAGLIISIWPYIVPRVLTFEQAASAPSSQLFSFIGVAIFLPFVIGYTIISYRVFRGKVDQADAYH
ncbi:cytochrome d ubiquinol oxidase, subunit II [gamma proteobacterium HTCC5015]|nr:cytochrome d ubiquinol oxidase, subunit II [gamma proteobacterium HTCC5015]